MAIYLNDHPLDAPDQTLGAILQAADKIAAADQHIVIEVCVDDDLKYGEELADLLTQTVDDKQVKIITAHKSEVAIQTLDQVRAALDAARNAQADAADFLQRDDTDQAMVKVSESLETWQATQQAVSQVSTLMNIDIDKLKVNDNTAQQIVENLLIRLREMKDLIEAGDTVALADVLAYEWPDMTDQWEQLIGLLIAQID